MAAISLGKWVCFIDMSTARLILLSLIAIVSFPAHACALWRSSSSTNKSSYRTPNSDKRPKTCFWYHLASGFMRKAEWRVDWNAIITEGNKLFFVFVWLLITFAILLIRYGFNTCQAPCQIATVGDHGNPAFWTSHLSKIIQKKYKTQSLLSLTTTLHFENAKETN